MWKVNLYSCSGYREFVAKGRYSYIIDIKPRHKWIAILTTFLLDMEGYRMGSFNKTIESTKRLDVRRNSK